MISVGIDVSKGKSTVCILKPYGETLCKPFPINHCGKDLESLSQMILRFNDEVKVVMESTGIYHLPVLSYLKEQGIFVSVINPYAMNNYARNSIRRTKTDKHDALMIANYGLDNWFKLEEFTDSNEKYAELKILGRQYSHYMDQHVLAMQGLTHMLDYTMPGIKKMLAGFNETSGKNKLGDFVEKYWHFDNIASLKKDDFIEDYVAWAKEKEYCPNRSKAEALYDLAISGIPTLPSDTPSTKMLVLESVKALRDIDSCLMTIIARMKEVAKTLPEYHHDLKLFIDYYKTLRSDRYFTKASAISFISSSTQRCLELSTLFKYCLSLNVFDTRVIISPIVLSLIPESENI